MFYQVATATVGSVVLVGLLVGAHVTRCLDIAVVGVGTFLFFGRLGCFSVACCHGRPARFGVVYGAPQVRVGLWSRWSGRRLWPTQLVEAGITAALVTAGIAFGWDKPGLPTLIYGVGYGVCRFYLETRRGDATRPHAYGLSEAQLTSIVALVFGRDVPGQPTLIYGVGYGVCRFFLKTRRGDLTRPHAYGLSEAQLTSIVILAACAVWYQSIATEAAFVLVAASAAWIARSRTRRELAALPHLHELDKICAVAPTANAASRRSG